LHKQNNHEGYFMRSSQAVSATLPEGFANTTGTTPQTQSSSVILENIREGLRQIILGIDKTTPLVLSHLNDESTAYLLYHPAQFEFEIVAIPNNPVQANRSQSRRQLLEPVQPPSAPVIQMLQQLEQAIQKPIQSRQILPGKNRSNFIRLIGANTAPKENLAEYPLTVPYQEVPVIHTSASRFPESLPTSATATYPGFILKDIVWIHENLTHTQKPLRTQDLLKTPQAETFNPPRTVSLERLYFPEDFAAFEPVACGITDLYLVISHLQRGVDSS
jgi:hypothetical protein